ncbi:MAG: nucleoside triphosphate pyrophosphohydrolase [Candidatus Falkowbacteria bacterium]
MTMKIFNKLVRDKIPEIIEAENKIPKIKILSNDEYKLELLKKLVEESKEVLEAKDDKEDLIKELGDLLEVIDSTVKTFSLNLEDILVLKDKRKQERGGFDKQIFLESVE